MNTKKWTLLGAVLLDKKDPTKVIGQLQQPLLTPNEEERSGYVSIALDHDE